MKNSYDDIINFPRHKSKKHPPMARDKRAAQFAPFAALNGHEDAVKETGRITDKRVELDEYIKADLNKKLCTIEEYIEEKPKVTFKYFQEDDLKEGGTYIDYTGLVKKIDRYKEIIFMDSGREIPINDIVKIN